MAGPIFYRTALGRLVNQATEYEKDAILDILYKYHYEMTNPNDQPMSFGGLSMAMGWSRRKVLDRVELLVNRGLVERMRDAFRISAEGVEFVDNTRDSAIF